jgi:hypothetical protein
MWLFANVLYGAILNLTPLVLSAYIAGHVVGFVLQRIYPDLGHGHVDLSAAPAVAGAILGAILLAVVAVGWRRFRDREVGRRRRRGALGADQLAKWSLVIAAALTALFVVMPLVVSAVTHWTSGDFLDTLGLARLPWRAQRVLLGLIAVAAALSLGGLALWLLQRRLLRRLRGALAALAVHNRRYSMHFFYRERLQEAFALRRPVDRAGTVVPVP